MSNEDVVTIYDASSNRGEPLAWNLMVWRARYALNFKRIPHKTVWLEYPDIEPTLRTIGAAPTAAKPDGSPLYTLPVIVDPSHRTSSGGPTIISDSWAISEYLDKVHPSPGLLLPEGTKALQWLFLRHATTTLLSTIAVILAPVVYNDILNEASRPYWKTTRELILKTKFEDTPRKGTQQWDDQWLAIQKAFTSIATLLDKNGKEGDLVMGDKVTATDFGLAGILESLTILVPEEWDKRVKHWDNGRWEKLRNHCAPWKILH